MYSLIVSAKMNGVDPLAWLADVLARIAIPRIGSMNCRNWRPSTRRCTALGLAMHVNKVSHVRTMDLVAKELGEEVDFLFDVALEMEPEDGVIWVQGLDDESVMAFTDFGVESLVELIKIHREMPSRGADLSRKRRPLRPTP